MKNTKKSLLQQLKRTILALCFAMLTLWFLFYIYMNFAIKNNTMHNMERVSSSVIIKLEQSFLELEYISFEVSENEAIRDFLTSENRIAFHENALQVMDELEKRISNNMLAKHLILYNQQGEFYRFYGNISNTAAKSIYFKKHKEPNNKSFQFVYNGLNYIGYADTIYCNNENIGKIVFLIEENDIYKLFLEAGGLDSMSIGLTANESIIVTNDEQIVGLDVQSLKKKTEYMLEENVGFTPFGLIVVYKKVYEDMILMLFIAIMVTLLLIGLLVRVFFKFWKNKFILPMEAIIQEVEKIEGGKVEKLKSSGLEYFDGLITGINDMLFRIERKELELLHAAYSLQEADIKKQKALIVSLKKQINAHFTVNILNIIKALAVTGEHGKAGLLCDDLSYLFRYANDGETLVNAMEEFFVLNKYLEIMTIRYPERFLAEVEMEDFLETIELPRMLIQPIIENAIVHGFKGTKMDYKIHVYCIQEKNRILFIVEDNGIGMSSDQLNHIQKTLKDVLIDDAIEVEGLSHVALQNIQRRIVSYFGKAYGLEISSKLGEGVKVTLSIPNKCKLS